MELLKPLVNLPSVITDIIFGYYYEPKIVHTPYGGEICALLPDGTLHRWTAESYVVGIHGIRDVTSNGLACAAVTWDDDIIAWGDASHGGLLTVDARRVIADARSKGASVTKVHGTSSGAFCALFSNGSVASWGHMPGQWIHVYDLEGAIDVRGNGSAFAALMSNGKVRTWGHRYYGGNSNNVENKLHKVVKLYCTNFAFAALRDDGTVVTWGHGSAGGSTKNYSDDVIEELYNVVQIYNSTEAFAALRRDGAVITWGGLAMGGNSSGVSKLLKDVESVCSAPCGFAALRKDGSVATWGPWGAFRVDVSGVVQLCATKWAFTALTDGGRVVTWGGPPFDGTVVQTYLTGGVRSVCADSMSGISIARRDGRTVVWQKGTDVCEYTTAGNTPFTEVVSTGRTPHRESSYAAIDAQGNIVTWGGRVNEDIPQTVHGVVWPGHDCGIQRVLFDKKTSIREQFYLAFGYPAL